MKVQFCNEAKSCACWLVNETLRYETETRPRHLIFIPRRDRDRDLPTFPQDRDETETFGNYDTRLSRDRDIETETASLVYNVSSNIHLLNMARVFWDCIIGYHRDILCSIVSFPPTAVLCHH